MWTLLKTLLAQWAIWKLLLKSLGSLAWLVPLAFILKAVGLPLLILLAVLALPLIILLMVLGLPILLVVGMGGLLLTLTMGIVGFGLTVLKLLIPIALIWFVLRWLFRDNRRPPESASTADAM